MLSRIKSAVEQLPEPVGRLLVHVPFSLRLGRAYSRARAEIARERGRTDEQRRALAFERFRRVVAHALAENPFYRDFYARHGFELGDLRGFDDIGSVPVVRKEDLRAWSLEDRSVRRRGRLRSNTGGTSGQPLEFYLDRRAFAREWAHMHTIWERVGYRRTDLKLTFRGKNLGARVVRYNPVHHEYLVSAYHSPLDVRAALHGIARREPIRYVHGYPSAIYEFAREAQATHPELVERLRASLRGIFLGSEYPAPAYRTLIEEVLQAPTLSWYGHSEMAVLARERDEKFSYVPFSTYGLAEAVPGPEGHRLVGTSYDNLVSPFIRYDTGDLVEPTFRAGMLESFRVTAGRTGDFILDRNGHRISLTALIFGRHHALFGAARFVQIRQDHPGQAVVLVTADPGEVSPHDWRHHFDTSGVAIDFELELRSEPVRTAAGKVPLLVPTVPDSVLSGMR